MAKLVGLNALLVGEDMQGWVSSRSGKIVHLALEEFQFGKYSSTLLDLPQK